MPNLPPLRDMIAGVKIFASYDAHEREVGTHRPQGFQATFDTLYQTALSSKLASAAVFSSTGLPPELVGMSEAVAERPRWYPANTVTRLKPTVLRLAAPAFERSWLRLRLLAEPPARKGTLWDSDPALVFDLSPGVTLCRAACIGHEGHVFFFVYPKERAWEAALNEAKLTLHGEGEQGYRQLLPDPGKVAG